MCGVAGIVRFDERPIEAGRLEAMRDHLRHRGPDGQQISDHGRCALVHTRLAVLDPAGGAQPMHLPGIGEHGALHVVFNGEIYNHRALRGELERHGHTFRSDHCDTEVLLAGFRQWGGQLPRRLHGMFAFAIWDQGAGRLFLARDRTGKKPLYLRWGEGELSFASLPGTLLMGQASGQSAGINREALLTYLRFGYCFHESLIAGVHELPAAHAMSVEPDGRSSIERFWQPPPLSRSSTELGAAAAVREVLDEAVSARLEADVPLGCFLSGGVDSSLVAAIAQQQLRQQGAPALRTFSMSMPSQAYDESAGAEAVARHIGSSHTRLEAEPGDLFEELDQLMSIMGEPTFDSSILPTFWLARATREHVTVALSGDGGDELFAGYERYRALAWLQRYGAWIGRLPAGWFDSAEPRSRRTKVRRLIDAARAGHAPAAQYRRIMQLCSEAQLRELGVLEAASTDAPHVPNWPDDPDAIHAAMRWDLHHYLPFDLLRKIDRAAMAHALEVRCPLLDTAVCDLAGHLPSHVLMPHGQLKGLLRQVARTYLPGHVLNRPKRGFAVPIGAWFREALHDELADRLFDGSLDKLGLKTAVVERWLDEHTDRQADHTHRLFAMLQLSNWCRWMGGEFRIQNSE